MKTEQQFNNNNKINYFVDNRRRNRRNFNGSINRTQGKNMLKKAKPNESTSLSNCFNRLRKEIVYGLSKSKFSYEIKLLNGRQGKKTLRVISVKQ